MSSLATRCTACGTVFKVVQDQLKVSTGWVRCGRCDTVFNALEELFELNGDTIIGGVRQPVVRPTLPGLSAQARTDVIDAGEAPPPIEQKRDVEVDDPPQEAADEHDEFSRSLFGPHRKNPDQTPSDLVKRRDRNEFADAQFDSDLMAEEDIPQTPQRSSAKPQADYTPPLPTDETPAFVRHADRQARWKSPRARWLLSLASLFMAVTLGLQVAHHWRDRLAAEIPASTPYLSQWCGWLHCQVETLRSINDITVETSALNRLPQSSDAYRLSVTLRNRGHLSVRPPSVDLSVNDGAGQLLARRTLHPSDFQVRPDTVAANSEVTLALVLKSANPRVNGYTVEVFYP
ncbi:MAG: hypothetical protein RIS44_328 [Pseudomonadota bacterium]|jgi:predicted Zn finger-like uncharacterized protein